MKILDYYLFRIIFFLLKTPRVILNVFNRPYDFSCVCSDMALFYVGSFSLILALFNTPSVEHPNKYNIGKCMEMFRWARFKTLCPSVGHSFNTDASVLIQSRVVQPPSLYDYFRYIFEAHYFMITPFWNCYPCY